MMRSGIAGVYVLIVEVQGPAEIEVGRLGRVRFEPGMYAYVGSALGGIEARLRRHLRAHKRMHWHIDYLLAHRRAAVAGAYVLVTTARLECRIARALAARFPVVPGFGSSDCGCKGHLFRCDLNSLRDALARLGLRPFPLPSYRPST